MAVGAFKKLMTVSTSKANCLIIIALIMFISVAFGVVLYVSIGYYTLEGAHVDLSIDIENMSVKFSNKSVAVTTQLRLGFTMPDVIVASPKLGSFDLSFRLNQTQMVRMFSESKYAISNHDQILPLNFQIGMQDQLVKVLQTKLHLQLVWIRVTRDLKMDVKLARFPGLPKSQRHVYFLCDIWEGIHLGEMKYKNCDVSREAFN
ncbi:hypothetical protein R6Q59_007372 [Mikania micrantha]